MFSRVRWLSFVLLCGLLVAVPASAQTSTGAVLSQPILNAFPHITTYLDIHTGDGGFVHGIKASDVRLLEDGQPLPLLEFEELRPGVQIVFAINPGSSFGIRNSQGISRYDFISNALMDWAKSRQGSTIDDLSLIATSGPERTHLSNPEDLVTLLNSYQIDAHTAVPSLDTLSRAVEIASDAVPRAGMERAILFVTPPLEGDVAFSLQNIISQANQQKIHIFVWLVTSTNVIQNLMSVSPSVKSLVDLAGQTRGQFFAFSGEENIPNPEIYLEPLRNIYSLAYDSQIMQGGQHQLAVEIQHGGEQIDTPALNFELNLLPPDPAFILPSAKITREYPPGSRKNLWDKPNPENLIPADHEIQVLIDFPDGRPRSLVSTRLYVDGQLAAENKKPPFDLFSWDLSRYQASGEHVLQVEAQDSLGLTGESIDTPVQINVESPKISPLFTIARNGPLIVGSIVLLAAAVLLLVLIVGGRIRPQAIRVPAGFRRRRNPKSDPVTQPVPLKGDSLLRAGLHGRRLPGWVNRLQWPQRRLAPKAFAYLTRLSETDQIISGTPVSITVSELTFGRDHNQATLVLDDPSVETLHARLTRNEDGTFRLADEGSIAGTWINYTPVSREGAPLQHGDLIHIGRVGFRFTQREPSQVRKPVVHLEEPPA
jgi:hypothetical protein